MLCVTGYPLHRENEQNNFLSGKTQAIWKFYQNTGNLVCSSCRFPDSKGKIYLDNFFFFLVGHVCQFSCVYVIVKNHINWQTENLWSDRENTGTMKMQFEWVP